MNEFQMLDLIRKWDRKHFSLEELSIAFKLTLEELHNKIEDWNPHLSYSFVLDGEFLEIENYPLFLQNLNQNYGIKKCEYCIHKQEIDHPRYYYCAKKDLLAMKNRIISPDPRSDKKCSLLPRIRDSFHA